MKRVIIANILAVCAIFIALHYAHGQQNVTSSGAVGSSGAPVQIRTPSLIPVAFSQTAGQAFAACENEQLMKDAADKNSKFWNALAGGSAAKSLGSGGICSDDVIGQSSSIDSVINDLLSPSVQGLTTGIVSAASGQNASSSLGAGMSAATIQSCEGGYEAIPTDKSNFCPVEGEGLKADALARACKAIKTNVALAACKVKAASAAEKYADCYKKEVDQLKKDIMKVKDDFTKNREGMDQYVMAVEGAITKAKENKDAASQKAETLKNSVEQVEQALAQLRGDGGKGKSASGLSAFFEAKQSYQRNIDAFEEAKVAQVNNDTVSCMQGRGTVGRTIMCSAAGAELSVAECAIKTYEYEIVASRSGSNSRARAAESAAVARFSPDMRTKINELLGSMTGAHPRIGNVQSLKARIANDNIMKRSPGAMKILSEQIGYCEQSAKEQLVNDLDPKNTSSRVGRVFKELANDKEQLQAAFEKIYDVANKGMQTAMSAVADLQGQSAAPFSLGACHETVSLSSSGNPTFNAKDFDSQYNCLKTAKAVLESLKDGVPIAGTNVANQNSGLSMAVSTVSGMPAICRGLVGCQKEAAKIAGEWDSRAKALAGSGTFNDVACKPNGQCPGIQAFRKQMNAEIRKSLDETQKYLRGRVQIVTQALDRASMRLKMAGVRMPSMKAKGESLQKACPDTSDRICDVPENFDDFIANLAGVPNLEGDEFNKAVDQTGKARDEAMAKETEFNAKADAIAAAKRGCEKEQKSVAKEKRHGAIDESIAQCEEGIRVSPDPRADISKRLSDVLGDVEKMCSAASLAGESPECQELKNYARRQARQCQFVADATYKSNLETRKLEKEISAGAVKAD